MPYYDFACKKCEEVYTVQRTINTRNEAPKSCSKCRGRKFIRIWTPIAFRFVGGSNLGR